MSAQTRTPSSWILDVHVYGGLIVAAFGAARFHLGAGLLVFGLGLIAISRWG